MIVVTDRRVLDKQLQDTIYQFEHKQGVVEKIDTNSAKLTAALSSGKPIVITTIQKFSFVQDVAGKSGRAYAVIVDEAHGSQTGESASNLKKTLAAASLEMAEAEDDIDTGDETEDEVIRAIKARGRQPNLSYFAFTATPKKRTIELFGQPGADGKPQCRDGQACRVLARVPLGEFVAFECWRSPAFGRRPQASDQRSKSVTYVLASLCYPCPCPVPTRPSPPLEKEREKTGQCADAPNVNGSVLDIVILAGHTEKWSVLTFDISFIHIQLAQAANFSMRLRLDRVLASSAPSLPMA